MAEGAFGSRWIIWEVICDFGWREDFAAEEIVLYNTQKSKCRKNVKKTDVSSLIP